MSVLPPSSDCGSASWFCYTMKIVTAVQCASNTVECIHDINQEESIGIKPVSYTLKTFIYVLFIIINSVYKSVMH